MSTHHIRQSCRLTDRGRPWTIAIWGHYWVLGRPSTLAMEVFSLDPGQECWRAGPTTRHWYRGDVPAPSLTTLWHNLESWPWSHENGRAGPVLQWLQHLGGWALHMARAADVEGTGKPAWRVRDPESWPSHFQAEALGEWSLSQDQAAQ